MATSASGILRLVSIAFCLVAVAWFAAFALEQSKTASAHQQAEVNAAAPASMKTTPGPETGGSQTGGAGGAQPAKKTAFHETVDDVFSKIASPFSGLTKSISSEWTLHIVNTLLALLIYGLGLGFLARVLRFTSR